MIVVTMPSCSICGAAEAEFNHIVVTPEILADCQSTPTVENGETTSVTYHLPLTAIQWICGYCAPQHSAQHPDFEPGAWKEEDD